MAMRKGGGGAPPRPPRAAQPDPETAEQLAQFAAGLHPILLDADIAAFRRYLTRWEELIGDSGALAEDSPEQVRQRMRAMLHSPQRFGLPPWPPAPILPASAATPASSPTDQVTGGHRGEWSSTGRPGGAGEGAARAVVPGPRPAFDAVAAHEAEPPHPGRQPDQAAGDVAQPSEPPEGRPAGTFQVDMLTGELVPVDNLPPPADRGSAAPAVEKAAARPPRRRRKTNQRLAQLPLWPDEPGMGAVAAPSEHSRRDAPPRPG